ncbi:Utp23p [Sugiyamaella lignohabitans]|uniref:Utp23p n=1 Tax=Sugiyamaella lignohabitans TaxID=796027 RepID=A0A167DJU5_9ASCO|nr:Utp23p [Sugiyamaella lignohabitans]ANB12993.1 Utp23p [Sugiyamaella lignohabitans]
MITQCTMNELYKTKNQEAIDLAKTFERRRCNHRFKPKEQERDENNDETKDEGKKKNDDDGPKSAFDCLTSVVNVKGKNVHRYVVATQKSGLRSYFRSIPAVPLIYMKRSVMIMEPMSPITVRARELIEKSKLSQGLNDPTTNLKRKQEESGDEEISENGNDQPTKKKRKGPKQPNPLSMKKKKNPTLSNIITAETSESSENSKKKRRRKHHSSGVNAATNGTEAVVEPTPASPAS